MQARVLVVDDEKLIRWSLSQHLTKHGFEVFTAEGAEDGLKLFSDELPEVVILDVRLKDGDGIEVLRKIREVDEDVSVIMITAHAAVGSAVEAMKLGAYDYITKPFELDKVERVVSKALEAGRLKREVARFRRGQKRKFGFEKIVGSSFAMQRVLETVEKLVASDFHTVLLQGPSGSGKDLVARALHFNSAHADAPFVDLNCSAIPESLIESELFGFEKGAFTDARAAKKGLFELAEGGSIFLDEISDMPLGVQSKLLKVIENRTVRRLGGLRDIPVDTRVIAATNRRLDEEVKNKRFREDLFYRLNVIAITLPSLAERREDIPALAHHFIEQFNREFRRSFTGVDPEAMNLLCAYPWPGNVRELRNVIERVVILEQGPLILPDHLPLEVRKGGTPVHDGGFRLAPTGVSLEEVERSLVLQAIELSHGNQTHAAQLLQISRDALRYRLQKYGLLQGKS